MRLKQTCSSTKVYFFECIYEFMSFMMQMTFPSFLGDEHQVQTIMRDQEILARMKDDSLTFSNTSAMIHMKSPESREISFDDSPLAFRNSLLSLELSPLAIQQVQMCG